MNWMRTILDGFAMAAYFNFGTVQSPTDVPQLPARYYQECAGTALKSGESLLLAMDLFWGTSAPLALRGSQHGGRRHPWVLADGADRIQPVDDDKPVRPVFSGYLSHTEKGETPFCNSWYGRAPWLWVQSVDEKLRIAGASVAMAIDPVSPDGGGAGRDRSIVDEIINIEEIM